MGPKLDEITLSQERFVCCFGDSLENFREISQVIDIMRLRWRRKQFFGSLDLRVEFNSGVDNVILEIGDSLGQSLRQVGEVPLEDSAEDLDERFSIEWLDIHQVEVPNVTHRHNVSTTDGRKHGCDKVDAAKVLELFGLEIVPTSVVHPLSQQFNRRLSAVLLLLRHVEIIDEDNNLITSFFRPILPLSSTRANLAINKTLNLISVGLA